MGKRVFIILLFLNSLFRFQGYTQSLSEVLAHQHAVAVPVHQTSYQVAQENKNEIQVIFSGLFLFYKNFVSSQDGISCVFTPSCSEYALLAIKKQGVIKGMANAIDRMTRCNGLSPEKYQKAPDSPLMIDELK